MSDDVRGVLHGIDLSIDTVSFSSPHSFFFLFFLLAPHIKEKRSRNNLSDIYEWNILFWL